MVRPGGLYQYQIPGLCCACTGWGTSTGTCAWYLYYSLSIEKYRLLHHSNPFETRAIFERCRCKHKQIIRTIVKIQNISPSIISIQSNSHVTHFKKTEKEKHTKITSCDASFFPSWSSSSWHWHTHSTTTWCTLCHSKSTKPFKHWFNKKRTCTMFWGWGSSRAVRTIPWESLGTCPHAFVCSCSGDALHISQRMSFFRSNCSSFIEYQRLCYTCSTFKV